MTMMTDDDKTTREETSGIFPIAWLGGCHLLFQGHGSEWCIVRAWKWQAVCEVHAHFWPSTQQDRRGVIHSGLCSCVAMVGTQLGLMIPDRLGGVLFVSFSRLDMTSSAWRKGIV